MDWAAHVARIGKVRIAYKILVGNLKEDQLEHLGVDKSMALNMGPKEIL
jgi:hypothetical protein